MICFLDSTHKKDYPGSDHSFVDSLQATPQPPMTDMVRETHMPAQSLPLFNPEDQSYPFAIEEHLELLMSDDSFLPEQIVKTPLGVQSGAWMYHLIRQICLDLNEIVVVLLKDCYCKCTTMSVAGYEYLCTVHKESPSTCKARSYIVHNLDHIIDQLTGP